MGLDLGGSEVYSFVSWAKTGDRGRASIFVTQTLAAGCSGDR